MSSNLSPGAKLKYQEYLNADSLEERIKKLEEFISLIPKHKSTEKIVALNKSRLSKLRRELDERKEKAKGSKKVSPFSIKKEGLQIILVSTYQTPGVGKTHLLNHLTSAAKEKIGKFTSLPEIGIYEYEKIRFQIVDMPSLMEGAASGVGNGKEILSQIRSCDLICLCVDLSRNIKQQMNLLIDEFDMANIRINIPPPPIEIQKTGSNKIQVFYLTTEAKDIEELEEFTEKVKEIVYENGIRNAIVKVYGKITLNDVVDALTTSIVYKSAIMIGTKGDLPQTEDNYKKLRERYMNKFPLILGTSVVKNQFPKDFGEKILTFLNKIRIYTMNNGIVSDKPLIADDGSTVKDIALKIHRSFYESFDHAIIIRENARQRRKRVGLEYSLQDRDIIELHTT